MNGRELSGSGFLKSIEFFLSGPFGVSSISGSTRIKGRVFPKSGPARLGVLTLGAAVVVLLLLAWSSDPKSNIFYFLWDAKTDTGSLFVVG